MSETQDVTSPINAIQDGSGAGPHSSHENVASSQEVSTATMQAQLMQLQSTMVNLNAKLAQQTEQLLEKGTRIKNLEQQLLTRKEDNISIQMEVGKLPLLDSSGTNWLTFSLKFKAHIATASEEAHEELERLEDPAEL